MIVTVLCKTEGPVGSRMLQDAGAMMKKGLDLREYAEEQKRWREANPREARLRDENMRLFHECEFHRIARICDWPTQAEAARLVRVHPATIGRAVVSATGVLPRSA